VNVDNYDEDAWYELREAIRSNDVKGATKLLKKNPELLHVVQPNSCLHLAASKGRLNIVQLLLNLGADINREIELYSTPLNEAVSDGHLEVVKYLVEQGASLAAPSPDSNPLYSAIYGGHVDVAKFLLEAGVDPHVVYRSESGKLMNALSYAQASGQTEIADLLINAGCRLPVEGVDKPVWQPEEIHESASADKAHEQIVARLSEQYGPVDPLALQEIVPVHDEVHVAIHVIRPHGKHPCLTLFTTGMSDRPMSVPEGQEEYQFAELIMHLPATWPHPRDKGAGEDTFWPFEWLRQVAYYPHLHDTWLGGPMTIISSDDPPVPLGPNTKQTCLLLLADFSDWSPIVLDDGKEIRFYTIVPIYTEERDFEIKNGLAPLLERLQARGFTTIVDVNRDNVAKGKKRRN
jgi:hypothetical protein